MRDFEALANKLAFVKSNLLSTLTWNDLTSTKLADNLGEAQVLITRLIDVAKEAEALGSYIIAIELRTALDFITIELRAALDRLFEPVSGGNSPTPSMAGDWITNPALGGDNTDQ